METLHHGDQIEVHGIIRDSDQIAAYDYLVSNIETGDEAIDVVGWALLEAAETLQASMECAA